VSLAAFPNPYSSYAIPAFEAMGLKRLPGLSSGKLSGYANIQATIDPSTGLRSSAENTFLNEAFGRTTLTTYINAHARNIVFGEKKAIGVNVTIDGRYPFVLSARKEVIVSAGVWHSPQLLMVSGIGPRATLDKFGVPVLSDLPGVGQNIWDSCPVSGPAYIVEDKKYDEWSSIPPGERAVLADSLLLQNASGPLTAQGSEYMGWYVD
jgi:choline dehydrogenase